MITFQLAFGPRCDASDCVSWRRETILELRGLFEEDIGTICFLVSVYDRIRRSAVKINFLTNYFQIEMKSAINKPENKITQRVVLRKIASNPFE